MQTSQKKSRPITAEFKLQDSATLDLEIFNYIGSKLETFRDLLYVKFNPIVNKLVSNSAGNTFKILYPPQDKPREEHKNAEGFRDKA